MSRIAKKPIVIPSGVTVSVDGRVVSVSGPKGSLTFDLDSHIVIVIADGSLTITKKGTSKHAQAMLGTTARCISNMITGVVTGFEKKLELNGVGYRMTLSGKNLNMSLGFSHPVNVVVPDDLSVSVEGNILSVSGVDRQRVGQFSAVIRRFRPVEPYKGKGFRYVGEIVRLKEGKKAAGSA
ncbi:MAG: 50S ribosomal protein L6 [Candidatus Moranbacteria bacterium]|nr:50S ribosomal protein L6 [Candidatus Moranbacteria bacterium]